MSEDSSDLTPLTPIEIEALKKEFPGLPADYVEFLASSGYGTLAGGPMLYSGPIPPEDVFGARSSQLPKGIILFGDDFAGTSFGFNTKTKWAVIAIDSLDLRVYQEAKSFAQFVKELV